MKNKLIKILMFILIILLFTNCNKLEDKEDIDTNIEDADKSREELDDPVDIKDDSRPVIVEKPKDILIKDIERMNLKDKIGQLLIVGFEGNSINQDIKSLIVDHKVGGFIFFSRNIANLEKTFDLVNNIKEINQNNEIPLFISIDEEGGKVSRLPKEFKKLPAVNLIGNIDSRDISFEYGSIIASQLNSLGFNLDFAPVLDINSNPNNPVIGDRAFSSQEEIVSKNALDFADGLKESNVIPVVKHFPGHGDTSIDSHKSLPIVYKSLEELKKFELLPFKKAIEKDIEGIMVAHILFDKIDKNYPASLSKEIITDILRQDLSFDGLVFSDDITMGAITENYSIEEASVKFLEAGGDVLLVCHGKDNPQLVVQAIEKAVEDKIINEEDINKKLYRILSLKRKHKIKDDVLMDYNLEEINRSTNLFLEKINK